MNLIVNVIINNLVQQGINHVLSLFGGAPADPTKNLERFLDIMTTEFTQRVESVIRDAFLNQNFQEVKNDLHSGATAFRTYAVTKETDQLGLACQKIIEARSRIFTLCREIAGVDPSTFLNLAPDAKGTIVAQRDRSLRSCITTLQAVASLDFLVLASKLHQTPAIRAEIITRIKETCTLAETLKDSYMMHQTFRVWSRRCHLVHNHSGDNFQRCDLKIQIYKDGALIQTLERFEITADDNDTEAKKRVIEREAAKAVMGPHSTQAGAREYLTKGEGNITASIGLWNTLKQNIKAL